MAAVKDISQVSEKWARVTPQRTEDYKLGIQNPRKDWATETGASANNYKLGVDAAQAKGLFAKGVAKVGTARWKEKALAKGPGRFAEGVFQGQGDYSKGMAPYIEAIKGADLGPRFPRWDSARGRCRTFRSGAPCARCGTRREPGRWPCAA